VLAIRAVDAAGNASALSHRAGFDTDATVSTVAFSAPAADPSVGKAVTFTFKASEGDVSYGCRLDGEAMHAWHRRQAGGPTVRPPRRPSSCRWTTSPTSRPTSSACAPATSRPTARPRGASGRAGARFTLTAADDPHHPPRSTTAATGRPSPCPACGWALAPGACFGGKATLVAAAANVAAAGMASRAGCVIGFMTLLHLGLP
jgi:hypothetical protein